MKCETISVGKFSSRIIYRNRTVKLGDPLLLDWKELPGGTNHAGFFEFKGENLQFHGVSKFQMLIQMSKILFRYFCWSARITSTKGYKDIFEGLTVITAKTC